MFLNLISHMARRILPSLPTLSRERNPMIDPPPTILDPRQFKITLRAWIAIALTGMVTSTCETKPDRASVVVVAQRDPRYLDTPPPTPPRESVQRAFEWEVTVITF